MKSGQQDFFQVKNLTIEYTSGGQVIQAVNGVSFSLDRSETLALVGETGAGKTTIAKSIMRILPNPQGRILDGSIEFDGEDILKNSEAQMRKIRGNKISMIFQDPMTALNPVITVGEQIAEVIRKHNKLQDKTALEQAKDMLEMVGISGVRHKEYPHQFSGGMKQRVVIAMALACRPELLLADEPTSALDVTIQAQILELITELRTEYQTSMILITHDLGVVGLVADKVAIVYAGEILEYGSREDIFLHPRHPYTIGLFGAIPDIAVDTNRLTNIKGNPPDPANLPGGCCFHPRCPECQEDCKKQKFSFSEISPQHFCSCGHVKCTMEETGHHGRTN